VLWQKFEEFRRGTNFLAWALRISDYKVMNFRQKQARRVAFADNVRDALMAEVASREVEAASASLQALPNCMERLTQSDRRMVTQCYAEGESVRQLAHAMGRSPQSIHHSLRRIRNWLLECIQRELRQADTSAPVPHDASDKEGGI
jgi:RNA polymerase sigma-70 factor (ECF subfamily)